MARAARQGPLRVSARLSHSPAAAFAFLADLRNHWRLEDRFVELGALDGDGAHGPTGGRVRVRAPLGVSREARTEVLEAEAPDDARPGRLRGRAEVGRVTAARVGWELVPTPDGTVVTLWAEVERAGTLDRMLLALGGAWWLERVFARALVRLDEILAAGDREGPLRRPPEPV